MIIVIDDDGDENSTNDTDTDGTIIIIDDGSDESTDDTDADGIIIDWSDTTSDYFYEKIYEDSAGLRLRNAYQVKDHWQIEQSLSFEDDVLYAWFTNGIIYTGDYFAQRFSFDGDVLIEYELTVNSDFDSISTSASREFAGPTGTYRVDTWLDIH